MGLKPTPPVRAPPPNETLETVYRQTKGKLGDKQLLGLVKQLDMSEREIQRWMRLRMLQNRTPVMSKFTESA